MKQINENEPKPKICPYKHGTIGISAYCCQELCAFWIPEDKACVHVAKLNLDKMKALEDLYDDNNHRE